MNTEVSIDYFSQNLQLYRKTAGYTQETMGNLLHLSRQAYANYECALREPSLSTLITITKIFNISIEDLLLPITNYYSRSHMEIERKYLLNELPANLESYESHRIEQGYMCTEPVIRIRRQDDHYILTYKSKGLMVREEYNLPLTKESYEHLKSKIDGILITKTRYLIPFGTSLTIELDVFDGVYNGLFLAEVEFASEEDANNFIPPDWFGEDVTFSTKYHNSTMSKKII